MLDFDAAIAADLQTAHAPPQAHSGTLVRLVGLTLEARGVMAPLGAICEIDGADGARIEAEVVGFNDKTIYLMPVTEASGIGPCAAVRVIANVAEVSLGPELLGRVIDGRGEPLDGKPAPVCVPIDSA